MLRSGVEKLAEQALELCTEQVRHSKEDILILEVITGKLVVRIYVGL